jgi:PAS domain S-box-containing protein
MANPGPEVILQEHAGQFFSLSLDLFCIAGYDGYFKHINPPWVETLGYSRDELLSKPYLSFVHPEDREATAAQVEGLLREGVARTFVTRYLSKDGSYKWLLWNSVALEHDQLIYAIVRDITAQRRKERRLAAQYAVTQVLSESLSFMDTTPKLLKAIGETVDWPFGVFWNVDQEANLLRCVSIWSAPSVDVSGFERVTGVMTFPPTIGLPGRVWSTGRPAWIPDILKDKNFPRMPFAASSGLRAAFGFPIVWSGNITGVIEFFSSEIQRLDDDLLNMMAAFGLQIGQFVARKCVEEQREQLIQELQEALANVKTLRGLLPICSSCKKIRDDKGYWNRLEDYILAHSDANITHGICTECARKIHPDWDEAP